ncbi:MAG: transcriptional repressor, partial [Parasporobacterium sp.]|nr:transcriptional repressor [Parasporobacterium sp.]
DHLICSKCGGIKDLYLSDITKSLKKEAGVEFDSYDLRLIYVCDKCKAV